RMLREHLVVTATSVDEGVAALVAAKFDLILCDVMMPDRTGLDMHAEVQRHWPELVRRLVFMSGGAFTPALQEFLDQPTIELLDKPLSPRDVDNAVRRIASLR
ncbi:MAG: response regulator, partial [Actinobacteria bacterium]|nr:response regulator [Actinomycetota bacterium]